MSHWRARSLCRDLILFSSELRNDTRLAHKKNPLGLDGYLRFDWVAIVHSYDVKLGVDYHSISHSHSQAAGSASEIDVLIDTCQSNRPADYHIAKNFIGSPLHRYLRSNSVLFTLIRLKSNRVLAINLLVQRF